MSSARFAVTPLGGAALALGAPASRFRGLFRVLATATMVAVLLAISAGASHAQRAAKGDTVTLSMLALTIQQPAFGLLIPNFERVYPNIKINITYVGLVQEYQLETTELAAGNAPDLLATVPGCGSPISICTLAKSGFLAPLLKKPWVKWSLPLVTSDDKYGQGLFAFTPQVAPFGVFTNNGLVTRLGLNFPQTFAQLLDLCQKAKAARTAALIFPGANAASVSFLLEDLAVATVYAKDAHWAAEQRAGTVSFDGSPGWRQALQEFVDMNNAGCFQPGATGTTAASAYAQFAQGQGLMLLPGTTANKGLIDAANPQFSYSAHPFPGGTDPSQTTTLLNLANSMGVNAHASAQAQAAAQTFVDFIARPKQNALYTQLIGGVTQYEFVHGQIPDFMSSFASVFKQHEYVIRPSESWWNANVLLALQTDGIGLITGQRSIDDVLNAMDAAWKQGPG